MGVVLFPSVGRAIFIRFRNETHLSGYLFFVKTITAREMQISKRHTVLSVIYRLIVIASFAPSSNPGTV